MRIEILCTGDEVLTGKIVNTNFSYMAQKLEDVGLSVHWGTTVGDDRESLLSAFKLAGERADGDPDRVACLGEGHGVLPQPEPDEVGLALRDGPAVGEQRRADAVPFLHDGLHPLEQVVLGPQ